MSNQITQLQGDLKNLTTVSQIERKHLTERLSEQGLLLAKLVDLKAEVTAQKTKIEGIDKELEDVTVCEGEDATFTILATGVDLTYEWYKGSTKLSENYSHIICSANTFGKNLMPRIAALLDISQVSDIIKVIAPDTFLRPIYAGNAFATVKTNDKIKCVTIRPTSFDPCEATCSFRLSSQGSNGG